MFALDVRDYSMAMAMASECRAGRWCGVVVVWLWIEL